MQEIYIMFEFNHNLAVVSPTSAKDNYLDINNNNIMVGFVVD